MPARPNPVMRFIEQLRDDWIEHTEDEQTRLLIWRTTEHSENLIRGFFSAQQQPGDWNTPDLFLQFSTAYDTCFGYSRNLREDLLLGYQASEDDAADQTATWPYQEVTLYDSAGGFLMLLEHFANHLRQSVPLRYLAVVLTPESFSDRLGWDEWLRTALSCPISPFIRLVLMDSHEQREHQPLKDLYPDRVEIIPVEKDLFEIMRATAIQSRGGSTSGPVTLYRQQLADMMLILGRGNSAHASACGERAIQLAGKHGWTDQQAIIHMMVAGAYLKERQHLPAIERYTQARQIALLAGQQGNPNGMQLAVQASFSEAGAHLMAEQHEQAAQAYLQGVELARSIPHPIFIIEGLRMAAQCFDTAKRHEAAQSHRILAIQAARDMSTEDRRLTTLPFVFQALLESQDRWRAEALDDCARRYQADIGTSRQEAEKIALQQGTPLTPAQSLRIEQHMDQQLEKRFQQLHEQREQLIGKAGQAFQTIIATARQMLHPRWGGLPEVQHPLDHEPSQWQDMPPCIPLTADESSLESVLKAPETSLEASA